MLFQTIRPIRPVWRPMANIRTVDCALDDSRKCKMAEWYSNYSKTYDQDGYHTDIAQRLVDGIELQTGDRILDLATGTGLAAILTMEKIEKKGSLVVVDISEDMLKVAKKAFEDKGIENVEMLLSDAQRLDLAVDSFDIIICSSALILFPNLDWTLTYWRKFLRPGGQLAVHCFSEESYVRGKLIQKVAAEFGIELVFSEPTGTVEKCQDLLQRNGYTDIRINKISDGKYLPSDTVLTSWDKMILHPMVQLPELVPNETIEKMKTRYTKFAEELVTDEGIWDDNTIMYVYGRKPA